MMERAERTTENKMKRRVLMRHEMYGTEETNRVTWTRNIIGHNGNLTRREKPGEEKNTCTSSAITYFSGDSDV